MPLRFRQHDAPEPKQQVRAPEIASSTPFAGFPPGTMFVGARSFGVDRPVLVEAASPRLLNVAMALAGELAPSDVATLSGIALPYNKPSSDLVPVQFERGCFGESVRRDLGLSFNFDASKLLGRTRSGTLQLSDDQDGLRFEVLPPESRWASDLLVSIARGDIRGIVAAFQVTQQRVARDRRIIERAVLLGLAVSSFYGFDGAFKLSRTDQDGDEEADEGDDAYLKMIGISGGYRI